MGTTAGLFLLKKVIDKETYSGVELYSIGQYLAYGRSFSNFVTLTIHINGNEKETAMQTKTRFISFNEFWQRIRVSLLAVLGCIFVGCFFSCCVVMMSESDRILWKYESKSIREYNMAVRFFQTGTANGIPGLKKDEPKSYRRYLEFTATLVRNESLSSRKLAYLRYTGDPRLFDEILDIPKGTWEAISEEHISPAFRIHKLFESNQDFVVARGVLNNLANGRELSLQKPKPNPSDWVYQFLQVLWLTCYSIICLIVFFRFANPNGCWDAWDLPKSPKAYLVMLLFAPAFVVPWACRGLFHVVYQPTRLAVKWVSRGAKTSEISGLIYKLKTRRARKTQKKVLACGADVIGARVEIAILAKAIECVPDAAQRQVLLAKLAEVKSWLEEVVRIRAEGGCANIPVQVKWLANRVVQLHEIETNRLR